VNIINLPTLAAFMQSILAFVSTVNNLNPNQQHVSKASDNFNCKKKTFVCYAQLKV